MCATAKAEKPMKATIAHQYFLIPILMHIFLPYLSLVFIILKDFREKVVPPHP
jgi:hypothetical protein